MKFKIILKSKFFLQKKLNKTREYVYNLLWFRKFYSVRTDEAEADYTVAAGAYLEAIRTYLDAYKVYLDCKENCDSGTGDCG